jgi:hypothetical protein
MKHKIFCFNNGGRPDWLEALAIGDDGHIVGNHICSHECFMKHDLGFTSNRKHDNYNKQYGEGNWELEWVDDPKNHIALNKAIEENKKLGIGIPDDIKAGVTVTFTDGEKETTVNM